MHLRKIIFYKPAIYLANFFLKLRYFLKQTIPAIMRPADLINISSEQWDKYADQGYSNVNWVLVGLCDYEKKILDNFNIKKGSILVLGSGAGRETIAFAKLGFAVTGLETSTKFIEIARGFSKKADLDINYIKSDFLYHLYPQKFYDLIHLTYRMYGAIPTRKYRVFFLKKLRQALKKDGVLDISFFYSPKKFRFSLFYLVKRIIAFITFGNNEIEMGDTLVDYDTFNHYFDKLQIESEIQEANFSILQFETFSDTKVGLITYAVLKPQ